MDKFRSLLLSSGVSWANPQQETGIMKTIIGVISLLGLRVDGVGFCVYDGLNDLDKVMLKYLFPLMMI